MTYAISNLQLCPICHDEDNPVDTMDKETLLKQKVKVLNCNHLFHNECINKFFFEGGINCPCCRAPIEKKDRCFRPCKDPYGFENKYSKTWEKYISKNEESDKTFIFEGVSQEHRDYILRNENWIFANAMLQKPDISITIPVDSLNQFLSEAQSFHSLPVPVPNIEVNFLVDENGICHSTRPSNNNE